MLCNVKLNAIPNSVHSQPSTSGSIPTSDAKSISRKKPFFESFNDLRSSSFLLASFNFKKLVSVCAGVISPPLPKRATRYWAARFIFLCILHSPQYSTPYIIIARSGLVGIKRPIMTFSFKPRRLSSAPSEAASPRTRVVSINDAAESHDSINKDDRVIPKIIT